MRNLTLSPMDFRECLAHVGCMSEKEFAQAFQQPYEGPNTCYQYMKFAVDYKRNVAKWICYLDLGNLQLLMNYLERHLRAANGNPVPRA